MIAILVAYDENRVIGKDNDIPWHLPEDLEIFKKRTEGQIVVMGRKTYDSIPARFRPLPNRMNIVVSKTVTNNESLDPNCGPIYCDDFEYALGVAICLNGVSIQGRNKPRDIYIIGGQQIYTTALNHAAVRTIIVSEVKGKHEGDVFFPELNKNWLRTVISKHEGFDIVEYVRYIGGLNNDVQNNNEK